MHACNEWFILKIKKKYIRKKKDEWYNLRWNSFQILRSINSNEETNQAFHTGIFFIIFAKFVVRKVTKYISKYKRLYGGVNNRIANDYQLQSTDKLFIKDAKYFCHTLEFKMRVLKGELHNEYYLLKYFQKMHSFGI